MLAAGRTGSVVTLLCDGGERYAHTYYDDEWVAAQGLDLAPHAATLEQFARTGEWTGDGERGHPDPPRPAGVTEQVTSMIGARRAACPRP